MRIIGGELRGRNFYMPNHIRCTQNVVRKAVFDILGQDMEGKSFLDLFAGSGAMGLEAHSRGAKEVIFIEKDPVCVKTIKQNIETLSLVSAENSEQTLDLMAEDSFFMVKEFYRQKKGFDLIYADPPYVQDLAKKALKTLGAYVIFQPNLVVVIQHDKRDILSDSEGKLCRYRQKTYGGTVLDFYRVSEEFSDVEEAEMKDSQTRSVSIDSE